MRPRMISRRRMLQGALAATATIPLLNSELARGQEATAPKRFVVFYTPNGTMESKWMPTGTENNFTLSPLLQPLSPFKAKIIPMRGVNMNVVVNSNVGSEHARGIGGLLTGARCSGQLQELHVHQRRLVVGDLAGSAHREQAAAPDAVPDPGARRPGP